MYDCSGISIGKIKMYFLMDLDVHSLTPIPTSILTYWPADYEDEDFPSMDEVTGTADIPAQSV